MKRHLKEAYKIALRLKKSAENVKNIHVVKTKVKEIDSAIATVKMYLKGLAPQQRT